MVTFRVESYQARPSVLAEYICPVRSSLYLFSSLLFLSAKVVSDYAVAKQFLSETDEAWAERVERLANATEETGGIKSTAEEVGNKFIMSFDASRHSQAIDRHEEHLNMVRTVGISDPVWKTLTQPVASKEEALLKLKSVKQRKPSKHLVEAQRELPRKNDKRDKELKKRGKQEKSARTRGDRTSAEQDPKQERCVLCKGRHPSPIFGGCERSDWSPLL